MQKKFKITVGVLLVISLLIIPVSGVKESFSVQNVEKSAMVKSMGFDDENEAVLSFVQSVIADSSPQHSQAVISASAESFAEAEKEAQILADKYLTLSYSSHFIIGYETARKGIDSTLEFLLASPILQLSSYVYISEGTAEKMLEDISRDDISTNEVLTNLNLAGKQEGYYYPVTVLDIAKSLESGECVLIPVIGESEEGVNTAKKTVLVFKGYAVVKGGKLKKVLNRAQSRAYNLLSGKLKRTVVSGKYADLTVLKSKSNPKVRFENGKVKGIDYSLKISSKFASLNQKNKNISTSAEGEITRTFSEEIDSLISLLKTEKLDALAWEKEALIQSFGKYEIVENELFRAPVKININPKIVSSFTLNTEGK